MRARHSVTIAVLVVISTGVIVVASLWAFQRSIIYQPDGSSPPPASQAIPGASDVTLHTSDGLDLSAWLVPAEKQAARGMAVLYAPGNGGSREGRAGIAELLADRGLTVLLMDYRGYGGNPGSPSEDGTTLDALAGVEALAEAGYPLEKIVFFGESIGGGVVANLQARATPAGVVLRSPFTSLADLAGEHFPWLPVSWLLRDKYPVAALLASSDAPMTVIYGDHDTIVPTGLSKQVAAAVPNLHEQVQLPGNHNDSVMFGPKVADAVARLADAIQGT